MSTSREFPGGLIARRRLLAAVPSVTTAAMVPGVVAARSKGVHLPADEAPHHEPTEWWYFNGHLAGVDRQGGRHHYGFEYVTFQFLSVAPAPVYIGNLAVTDLTRRTFQYAAEEDSYPVPNTPGRFALHTGPWSMTGRRGHDQLTAELPGYRLGLTLRSVKPVALHGRNGVIDFGPFGTSNYYSWTDLRVRGTVIDHGIPVHVTGLSWMDHQWGDFTFASGGGWDWFSIQLTNGQQYMLYFIRRKNGALAATAGTRVARDGRTVHLSAAAVAEHPRGSWKSRTTGITYPAGWTLTIPGGTLTVTPDLRDQEIGPPIGAGRRLLGGGRHRAGHAERGRSRRRRVHRDQPARPALSTRAPSVRSRARRTRPRDQSLQPDTCMPAADEVVLSRAA